MIADSTYLVEALLRRADLLKDTPIVSPDLASYEVINTLWKHQKIIRDTKDALPFIETFFELVEAGSIILVRPSQELSLEAYRIAIKYRLSFYDCIFVALALAFGTDLKTFDGVQMRVIQRESRSR